MDAEIPYQETSYYYGKIAVKEALLERDKCIQVTLDYDGNMKNESYRIRLCTTSNGTCGYLFRYYASAVIFTISLMTETAVFIPSTVTCSNGPWNP